MRTERLPGSAVPVQQTSQVPMHLQPRSSFPSNTGKLQMKHMLWSFSSVGVTQIILGSVQCPDSSKTLSISTASILLTLYQLQLILAKQLQAKLQTATSTCLTILILS